MMDGKEELGYVLCECAVCGHVQEDSFECANCGSPEGSLMAGIISPVGVGIIPWALER